MHILLCHQVRSNVSGLLLLVFYLKSKVEMRKETRKMLKKKFSLLKALRSVCGAKNGSKSLVSISSVVAGVSSQKNQKNLPKGDLLFL